MVRRPNSSDVTAHRSTASKLTQLKVRPRQRASRTKDPRKDQTAQEGVAETGEVEEV
jgi:hypothetical protein